MNFGFYFDRIFAGNEMGFERYRLLFEQLGDLGFERAKEGFVGLLWENSAKAVYAAFMVASQIPSVDEIIAEYRRLWEMAKVSLPDEGVTYIIANDLGSCLDDQGKYEDANVFYLAALAGQRRVLGEEHSDTLDSMNNLGVLLKKMEDYEGALDYYQQALRGCEKVLGKTHPDTQKTIMNMANMYSGVLKDYTKAEEMYRHALDGYEKSLGKDHKETKRFVRSLAILLFQELDENEKTRVLVKVYPHLLEEGGGFGDYVRTYIH